MSNLHNRTGCCKGKFTSLKRLKAQTNRSEAQKLQWADRKNVPQDSRTGNITDTMRRVVDFKQFTNDLWCAECNQPLSLKNFIKEEQHRLASVYIVRCQTCGGLHRVHSDKPS